MCHIKSISGPGHPRSPNWTLDFEPPFSQRFYFPLSPRSLFPTRQRFPIPNHVTSGCMSLRSPFSNWSAVSHIWARSPPFPQLDFGLFLPLEPTIPFSYSPAVSHSKSRHFRLHEPAIPFFQLVSGFPLLKTRDFRFRL